MNNDRIKFTYIFDSELNKKVITCQECKMEMVVSPATVKEELDAVSRHVSEVHKLTSGNISYNNSN